MPHGSPLPSAARSLAPPVPASRLRRLSSRLVSARTLGLPLVAALALGPLAVTGPAGADEKDGGDPPIAIEPPVGHEHGGEEMMERQLSTSAAPDTKYQMPFPCGQSWTGSTRSYHSPSPLSIDWNRTDDAGDPVAAAADGKVMVADGVDNGGYGKWIQLSHSSSESTLYAHLNGLNVRANQQVKRGDIIGYVGTTGNSTGTHLHFEEREGSSVRTPFFDGVQFKMGSTQKSKNCSEPDPDPEPEPDAVVTDPLAANMLGDAKADPTFYRRGPIHRFVVLNEGGKRVKKPLGTTGDQPVLGDWNGNGIANPGVRTPSTKTFQLKIGAKVQKVAFGQPRDLPIAGDWDGDGTDEIGVRRVKKPKFRLRMADGSVHGFTMGKTTDLPVTGDWNGDGTTDVGLYDAAARTFTLRTLSAGGVASGDDAVVRFGPAERLPVVGDWDGNGVTDLGTWNPSDAVLTKRLAPSPTDPRTGTEKVTLGTPRG